MKKILLLAFGLGVAIWLNYQKSVDRALQKACDGGTLEACLDLGNRYRDRYRDGEGIPQDFARVASLYEQACDGGDMRGCTNLGNMYQAGDGITQDLSRAASLYERACDGGWRPACTRSVTPNRAGPSNLF